MNERQREIYSACRANPPTDRKHAIGCAYWLGHDNPDLPVHRAGVGLAGSDTVAAFMAGRADARTSGRESESHE